jgi:hypothetical protein
MTTSDYDWALTGPVQVTCTVASDEASAYLVVGPRPHQALVLVEHRGGRLLINGQDIDLGDAYPQWLGLLDEANSLAEGQTLFFPPTEQ